MLVVVVDDAGGHVAGKLAVPPNVVLHHLPACTPELQPAEPLWPLVREALANKTLPTLAALTAPLEERCEWLAGEPRDGERSGWVPLGCRTRVSTDPRNLV